MLGLIVGLIRERLFRKLRSAEDVQSALELPCLGTIPDGGKLGILSLCEPGSQQLSGKAASSQLKMQSGLAHLTLALLAETKPLDRRVLTVTSLRKGEGVTSMATALAYNLCRLGKKVSLIDANIGGSHSERSESPKTGAASGLPASGAQDDHPRFYQDWPGLVFTPAEAIADVSTLERMINTARNAFDYVIIDAPPLEDGLDVLPTLNASDGVLLLLNATTARKSQVVSALASWSYMSGKILGAILNRARK
ncbi:cellulose synthase operon protein YhjQ/BcsQ [Microvirga sp. M2]|uniref:cellulose synthase operon protein YhjQ/BcsQ n=1 Tax=Microvirga sp. M2 TaxID=3073270 RepID=UPI0039C1D7F0